MSAPKNIGKEIQGLAHGFIVDRIDLYGSYRSIEYVWWYRIDVVVIVRLDFTLFLRFFLHVHQWTKIFLNQPCLVHTVMFKIPFLHWILTSQVATVIFYSRAMILLLMPLYPHVTCDTFSYDTTQPILNWMWVSGL